MLGLTLWWTSIPPCYRNQSKLQCDGPLGLYVDSLHFLFNLISEWSTVECQLVSSINIFDWLTPGYNWLINSQSTLQNMAVDTGLILDWHLVQQSVESQLLVSFDWSICLMTIQPNLHWVSVKMPRCWLWVNWVYQSTLERGCLKYMWSMNWSLRIMDKSQTMEKPVCLFRTMRQLLKAFWNVWQ